MKTSNKLLIALILLLFSVPLISIMGFKSAVKADRYIVKSEMGYEVSAPTVVKPFAAIKLNGVMVDNNFGLKTFIRYGDKYGYFIRNYDQANLEEGRTDSCRIRLVGDTLVVDYHLKAFDKINVPNYSYGAEIEITVPQTVPIIANFAMIEIDSSAASFGAMKFDLTAALLDLRPIAENRPGMNQMVLREITVNANNSSIKIGDQVNIKNLKIGLTGRSDINFRETASIDTISGHISEASFFNAPYRYSKFLK